MQGHRGLAVMPLGCAAGGLGSNTAKAGFILRFIFFCDIYTCIQFPHKRIPSCNIGTQLWLEKPTVSKVIAVVQVGLRVPTLQLVGTVFVNAWPGYRSLSVQT